jgi:hypothetical protein
MKLSDEEITTLFSFVKGALKRVAEETEREMLGPVTNTVKELDKACSSMEDCLRYW